MRVVRPVPNRPAFVKLQNAGPATNRLIAKAEVALPVALAVGLSLSGLARAAATLGASKELVGAAMPLGYLGLALGTLLFVTQFPSEREAPPVASFD
jgi:hypothetical protein